MYWAIISHQSKHHHTGAFFLNRIGPSGIEFDPILNFNQKEIGLCYLLNPGSAEPVLYILPRSDSPGYVKIGPAVIIDIRAQKESA
jgi:hypothetical protein